MAEPQAVTKLRDTLLAKGPVSYKTLLKKFHSLDADGNGKLTKEELKKGLSALDVELCDDDLKEIFDTFDKGGDGQIDGGEFMYGIFPPISQDRKMMVFVAFQAANKERDRIITIDDMRGFFDPRTDPGFRDGTKTADQVFSDFLKEFDEAETADGKVTLIEFVSYYAVKGKDIESDEEFQKLLNDTWKIR